MIYIVQACDYGRQPLCVGFTILQKVSPVIKAGTEHLSAVPLILTFTPLDS